MSETVGGATLISEAMRTAVGAEISRRRSFPVAASDIRRWAIATYYPEEPPQRYWKPRPDATGKPLGLVAPRDFDPFAWMAADPPGRPVETHQLDAIEQALGVPGPGLKVGLNGGLLAEYGAWVREGDTIIGVRYLDSYREVEGKFGRMLLTVTVETWTNQDDAFVQRRAMTLIRYGR